MSAQTGRELFITALRHELFTYQSLVHAISGGTGGFTGLTTFYPLNSLRLRQQCDDDFKSLGTMADLLAIAKKHGPGELYRGWGPSVLALVVSNFVYFYVYSALKKVYTIMTKKKELSSVANLGVGAVSGFVNVICTLPLWTASVRLATQSRSDVRASVAKVAPPGAEERASKPVLKEPYRNSFECMARIWSEEGFFAMWKGLVPSLMLVTNPTIQFFCYDLLTRHMKKVAASQNRSINSYEFFMMGAIAKAIATVLTYPVQLAQSKLRNSKKAGKTTISVLSDVFREGCRQHVMNAKKEGNQTTTTTTSIYGAGVQACFKGMDSKLWQTVLTAAFQFLTYEKVKSTVEGALITPKKQVTKQITVT